MKKCGFKHGKARGPENTNFEFLGKIENDAIYGQKVNTQSISYDFFNF